MAFKLIRNDEPLPARNLIILLFGEPGVSKTSLSFTAEDPVLFGFDAKGLDRAIGRKDAILFEKWSDCMEYLDSGEIERNKYKTAIIDTGGAMLDNFMAPHILGMNEKYGNGAGGLGLSGFGVLKSTADAFFTKMEQKGLDLIFICHSETEKEGDNMIRYPKMTGGARDILVQKADLIGYMEMRNNKITLEFSPTQRHSGKNCARFPLLEIPHFENEAEKFKSFMGSIIIKQTKDHMRKQNEAQLRALKVVNDLKDRIAAIDSIEALEKVIAEIDPLSPVYKAQALQFFHKKYAEIWAGQHFNENVKTPEDFTALAEIMKGLHKNVVVELYDGFRALLDHAGLVYVKDKGTYVPKGQEHKTTPAVPAKPADKPAETQAPAGTAPATTTAVTEEKQKEKAKEKPKVAAKEVKAKAPEPKEQAPPAQEATPPSSDGVHSERWFLDRVGKKVSRTAKDGKVEEVLISDENRAVHMNGVMQHHQGYRFADMATATQDEPEDTIQKEFDAQPEPETVSSSTAAVASE